MKNTVSDTRNELARLFTLGAFTSVNREPAITALVGKRTVELIGAGLVADQDSLFGAVDWSYVKREERWYDSMSRYVDDIPEGAPAIWRSIASKKDGSVNSNYGWCVYSDENGAQYCKVLSELSRNPDSRRAVIIYTRPAMWEEYAMDGRSDFMCTNVGQYLIRGGRLHACVQMRSNDAVFGYKNDRAWQHEVQQRLAEDLGLPVGDLYWQVGSLHVYERHFYLLDHFSRTGEHSIAKTQYCELYPSSPYCQTLQG